MADRSESPRALDFLVQRDDHSRCRFIPARETAKTDPGDDGVLLRIDRFGFTSNNITYALVGDRMSYWNFFPAKKGWGRIPVWGVGEVVRSRHEEVAVGERFYGYFPMSAYLGVRPAGIGPDGFTDAVEHRQAMSPIYNRYTRLRETGADEEAYMMLLRPLFGTAFLLDDFLADLGFFGADDVVLTSASSKTAFGLASLLARRDEGRVVGLTSPGNVPFVEKLGCYDAVLTYDDLGTLTATTPSVVVDMSGNAEVLGALYGHFGDHLKYSCLVGLTHWQKYAPAERLPRAEYFFAPSRMEKRMQDWGPAGFQERYSAAWKHFMTSVNGKIGLVRGQGEEAVERIYRVMLEGRSTPDEGHVLSLV